MRILLAVDGSACSNAGVAEICRRPWPAESEVRVVTATVPIDPPQLRGSALTVFDEIVKQQRMESAKHLRDAVAELAERASGLHVTTALLEGWPKDAIVTEAERWGADLIVVGSHGYGPIRRFFLGSVSMFIAHHAPCSVLIVREPPEISPAGDTPATAATS